MQKDKVSRAYFDLAAGIARRVLDPDYYTGPWAVDWHGATVPCPSYGEAVTLISHIRENYKDGWTAMLLKI